jgi:uncharacterized membrane protein
MPQCGGTEKNMQQGSKRYRLIDAVRGLCVISMVLYHLMYDVVYIIGAEVPWYSAAPGHIWQQSICRTFIFIAGMSFCMSKRPLRRGVIVSLCGALVSVVTAVVDENLAIVFGILTFIGAAYIVMSLLRRLTDKVKPAAGLIASLALFALTRAVPWGYLGFDELLLYKLPDVLYSRPGFAFFGFPSDSFHSTDYFAFIPWIFMFAAGYFFWRLIRNRQSTDRVMSFGCPPLEWIGRHALVIYLLHQPVLYGVSVVICVLFR